MREFSLRFFSSEICKMMSPVGYSLMIGDFVYSTLEKKRRRRSSLTYYNRKNDFNPQFEQEYYRIGDKSLRK